MAKPAPKTVPTKVSATDFLAAVPDERRRKDAQALLKIMKEVTKWKPVMWGPSIVGFGKYHYKYESCHEGDCCLVGFSPRKSDLTIYVLSGFTGQAALLKKLGKHKTGKVCLYIKKLEDVDIDVLKQMIAASVSHVSKMYPAAK